MISMDSRVCDQFCIFRVGAESFAMAAKGVREVVERPGMVRVPDSPPALLGVCHLRNEFLPVLSLHGLLIEGEDQAAELPFVLVMTGADGPWAVPISRALDLEALETASTADTDWSDPVTRAVVGTATFRDEVVRVLDADALYRLAEELLESVWRLGRSADDSRLADHPPTTSTNTYPDELHTSVAGSQA